MAGSSFLEAGRATLELFDEARRPRRSKARIKSRDGDR
jgi:hypothetical protein